MEKIGTWAFLLGVLISIIVGLQPIWRTPAVIWTLIVLGVIVGFLNVKAKEVTEFLVAVIAILIVAAFSGFAELGAIVRTMLSNIITFVAPAALVVALKAVWDLA